MTANHGRGTRRVRRDGQNTRVTQEPAAMTLLVHGDSPKLTAVHVRDPIMFSEPLVEKRIVGLNQIKHTAILTQNAVEEKLCLLPHRLSKVVVKVRKQTHIRNDGFQVAKIKPLTCKVLNQ